MTDPTRDAFAVDEETINLALDAWFDGDCSRPHYDEHIDQMRAAASVIVAALSARAQGEAWPSGVLNRETTLHVLTEHNAWRRGTMTLQTDPVLLGKAIDAVIAAMQSEAITTPAVRAVDVDEDMVDRACEAFYRDTSWRVNANGSHDAIRAALLAALTQPEAE